MANTQPSAEEHVSIHQAARDGNTETVFYHIKRWSKKKHKINKLDRQELSALHYAVRYCHFPVVELLVTEGADVHCVGQDGAQPIHYAARHLRSKANSSFTSTTTISISSDEPRTKKQSVGTSSVSDTVGTITSAIPTLSPLLSDSHHQNILQFLLKHGADPNAQDIYGQTPLHYAALKGNILATEILLSEEEVSIEIRDKSKASALHTACGSGCVGTTSRLLQAGASLMALDDENLTPFHYAVSSGHNKIIDTIIEAVEKEGSSVTLKQILSDKDRQDQNALHFAVDNGHYEIASLILEKGASANEVRNGHVTPLHVAAASGRLDLMTLLIANGARINTRNVNGETALHKAAAFNRTDAVSYLLSRGANINVHDEDSATPLIVASANGNTEVVECLLKRGAALHVKDVLEKTAIYWAAQEDSVSTLKVLLEDPRARQLIDESDRYDNTPLHIAAVNGYLGVVRILLLHGAEIDACNDEDLTPLHLAAKHGKVSVVKEFLMKQPSIITNVDESGNTPLHLAAISGHAKVIDVLVDVGASVDARNVFLWTPLDCAAAEGHLEAATVLLDRDSPLDPQDKSKTTPLHLASREGHLNVVKLLLERDADVTLRDTDGKNCLDMAIESGHGAIAGAILDDKDWLLALKNRTVDGGTVSSPFRKMIKKLPDIALRVCNQMMKFSKDVPITDDNFKVTFFYEILDDIYADWSIIDDTDSNRDEVSETFSNFSVEFKKEGQLKQLEAKSNHPLHIMAEYKQEQLLNHPLVRSLLELKWRKFGRFIYYSKLLLFTVYLFFLTAYVVVSTPLIPNYKTINGTKVCQPTKSMTNDQVFNVFVDSGKFIVLALAIVQMTMEIIQAISRRLDYISLENVMEWGIFICTIIYVSDDIARITFYVERCSVVHRSLGSVTIFLAWLDLLLFLRKFPKHGIFIVMFTDILNTFIQFFVTFSLFIIAFALGFYTLLHRQLTSFENPGRSIMKILVMMIGEFDFDTIFNEERSHKPPVITWILFAAFVIVMTIILMNLLVGLAVDDIKGVQDQAVLNRLRMQVDLVLDVEKVLPRKIRKNLSVQEESVYPNRAAKWWRLWGAHRTTIDDIRSTMNPTKNMVDVVREKTNALHDTVHDLRRDVYDMQQKLERIESMMAAFLAHHQIES